jgi:hypothetical protein
MYDQEQIQAFQERLVIHRANLAHWLRQASLHGGEAYSSALTINAIKEARSNIDWLKTTLGDCGIRVPDHPDDTETKNLSNSRTHQTELTSYQELFLIRVAEIISMGTYSLDIRVHIPNEGEALFRICEDFSSKSKRNKEIELRGIGEGDLIYLAQTAYISLIRKKPYDPCAPRSPQYIFSLAPKAFQLRDMQKADN